jgi:hypothetical protein
MRKVQAALELPQWYVEIAVTAGLLRRDPVTRSFDEVQVMELAADLPWFREALAPELPLNTTAAAHRTGVSWNRFRRAADESGLEVIHRRWIQYYGKRCEVRYYRTRDVDAMAGSLTTDPAEIRREAADRAAATRARNWAMTTRAREEFATAHSALLNNRSAAPEELVAWACGLAACHPDPPVCLVRGLETPEALRIAALVGRARLSPREVDTLLGEVLPAAGVVAAALRDSESGTGSGTGEPEQKKKKKKKGGKKGGKKARRLRQELESGERRAI